MATPEQYFHEPLFRLFQCSFSCGTKRISAARFVLSYLKQHCAISEVKYNKLIIVIQLGSLLLLRCIDSKWPITATVQK